MLKQEMFSFDEEKLSKTVYIKASQQDTIASINHDIKLIEKAGYKYIFIDEVTLIDDFIDSVSLFSDVFAARGQKIVLSGTDSLCFYFAEGEELYDRAEMIRTTFIPYYEHARLLGITDIDEYTLEGSRLEYTIFTQPGMRFCQAQALVYSLLKDPQILKLNQNLINLITGKIIEGVLGHMLEDIVIYEAKRKLIGL